MRFDIHNIPYSVIMVSPSLPTFSVIQWSNNMNTEDAIVFDESIFDSIREHIHKNKHKNKTIVSYSDTAITQLRKAWDEHEICAISLEPIHPDSGGVLTACKHVFNAQFLYHLCSTQHSPSCPLCRTPIELKDGGFTIRCTPFYRTVTPLAFFNTNSRFAKRRTRKRIGVCNTDIITVNNIKQQSHNLK